MHQDLSLLPNKSFQHIVEFCSRKLSSHIFRCLNGDDSCVAKEEVLMNVNLLFSHSTCHGVFIVACFLRFKC